MSGFNEGQIVKTQRDNEFKIKIVDGQSGESATKVLTIEQDQTLLGGSNNFGIPVLFKTDDASPKLVIPRTDPAGNIKVVIVPSSDSTKKIDYMKHDSIAQDGTSDHSEVITNLKTGKDFKIIVSGLGLNTWEIGSYNGTTLTTYAKIITSPAHPVATIELDMLEIVGDGTNEIMVRLTNKDRANDAYSTIQWIEETT